MRYSALFINSRTGKIWAKSYTTRSAARRAVSGILKKTTNSSFTKNEVKTKSASSVYLMPSKGLSLTKIRQLNKKRY